MIKTKKDKINEINMNYTTSKMYSCHLSDCGLTNNSVYIRMFVSYSSTKDRSLIAFSRFELLGMYSAEGR